uniref:Uncharacterized protein n=1 Tax=Mola mola TaxID=94237 RepID=A0A3Q3WNE4_MOLML
LDLLQMQDVSESAYNLNDDMVDGDLGDGMEVRAPTTSVRKKSQTFAGLAESHLLGAEWLRHSSQALDAVWLPGVKIVIDMLCCELEVAHRYIEGKYEALKILQGKAILDKATSHIKTVLQKSEEKAKALEKEVNSLQWELSFNQGQMKRSQLSWEQKNNRSDLLNIQYSLFAEDNLETGFVSLNRQCLELLSMLNVKEQRNYQETKPQYGRERDASVLELAVLGACRCPGVSEACPCSRTAAASRKQLIQLQQELNAQCSRREEALMVADAFRIAFEQQLRKRSEHFLLLTEANILKSHHEKAEGSAGHTLDAIFYSVFDGVFPVFLLQLNDKEVALAHQKKVSVMLAHSAEELQRKLHMSIIRPIPVQDTIRASPKSTREPEPESATTRNIRDTTHVSSESNMFAEQQLCRSQTSSSEHQSGRQSEYQPEH